MANFTESEVEEWVDILTSNHMVTLAQCLGIEEKTMDAINRANKDAIFKTATMLNDWIREGGHSNCEKRRRLTEARKKIHQHGITSKNCKFVTVHLTILWLIACLPIL